MANVLTRTGKSIISNRIKGESSEPNVVGWGLNYSTPITAAATDVGFFNEAGDARTAGTSSLITTTYTNDTYQVIGTQTAGGSREIREVGLTNSTTKPTTYVVETGSGVIGSNSSTELKTTANWEATNKTYVQIRGEVLEVESGHGTKNLTVSRAKNGSTASTVIAAGDTVTPGNIPGPYSTGTTGPVTGASLFTHADLSLVSLNSGDSIQWTWVIQFT